MKTRGLFYVRRYLGTDIVDRIQSYATGRSNCVVLEVGCGVGNALAELKQIVPQIRAIGMNLKRVPRQIISLECVYGNAGERIPLDSNTVDYIYSIVAFPFVHNRAKVIEELFRVLKPGGEARFDLWEYCRGDWWRGRPLVAMDTIESSSGREKLHSYLSHDRFRGSLTRVKERGWYFVMKKNGPTATFSIGLEHIPEWTTKHGGYAQNFYRIAGPSNFSNSD